jgi:hypothetical protein
MISKKLTAIAVTFTSLFAVNAFAQSDYQLSCDTNINSNIEFANNQLVVKSTKDEDILFKSNGVVFVDGKEISLTSEEQSLTKSYYSDVEASIPMVVDITVEALNITSVALTEVFKGLLGENTQLPAKLDLRINGVATAIKEHVYQDPDSLTFNSGYLKGDLGLGDNLDEEIEEIKEEVVSSMMGQLLMAIGKSMLNGDGNFADLEQRMTTLGQDIEQKAQALAKGLEEKSKSLCDKIKSLDDTEEQLRKIDELRYLDTIHFNNKA